MVSKQRPLNSTSSIFFQRYARLRDDIFTPFRFIASWLRLQVHFDGVGETNLL